MKFKSHKMLSSIDGSYLYPYECDIYGHAYRCVPQFIFDKTAKLRTFMHYTDSDAGKEITVFGASKKGLFYNYDDRLYGNKWNQGLKLAGEQAVPDTARFYEIALNHFHDTDDVNLQHILLGCNRTTGFSYLVFGYTYTSKD